MEDYEEKQLKADIMRKTMFSMDTRARTEVTVMAELIELRAWKAKARPYIEERLEFLQNCLEEASGPIDEGFEVELKELEELSELTELLGGSDE